MKRSVFLTLVSAGVLALSLDMPVCAQRVASHLEQRVQGSVPRLSPVRKHPFAGRIAQPMPFAALQATDNVDAPTLYGIVCNRRDQWTISSFKAAPGITFHEEFVHEDLYASGGAVYAQGKLYVNYYYEEFYESYTDQFIFTPNPWQLASSRNMHYDLPTANVMTYDATTGQVYMQQVSMSGTSINWQLSTMNLASGEAQYVAYMSDDEAIVAMAASPEGVLYAINTNGMLEIVDKTSGKVFKVGNTDIKPAEVTQSAAIDPATGTFYWAAYTDEDKCQLYTVDLTTAKATLIGDFPCDGSVPALFFMEGAVNPDAPAMVDDLQFEFDGPSLNGQLTFTAPTKSQNGATMKGQYKAQVSVAGQSHTLTVTPGQRVSLPLSLTKPNYYNAAVTLSNESGKSRLATLDKWLGPDYPVAPSNLKLESIEGTTQIRLTWDAPTVGEHGGYVNPDEVIYFIYGNEPYGQITWIEEYHDTEFTKDVAGISQTLIYQVRSSYMELNGGIAKSNSLYVGSGLTTPCSIGFGNEDKFSRCTIIDANHDGKTWEHSSFGYATNLSSPADDWIITEGINIQAGKRYKVSVGMGARNGLFYPSVCQITMGTEATAEAQTIEIGEINYNTFDNFLSFDFLVSVTESNIYYIGVHDISTRNWETRLTSVSIEEEAAFVAPDAVTDLTITPGEMGALTATLSFRAPMLDVNGSELAGIDQIEIKRGREIIGYVDAPAPGSACTFVDDKAKQGNNTYTITAINAEGGRGVESTRTVWCGEDVPGLVRNLQLTTEGNIVRLSWDAPLQGLNGGYINPDNLDYLILDTYYGNVLETVHGQTWYEWTFDPNDPEQYTVEFAVAARNVAGTPENAMVSNSVLLGRPYELPIREGFDYGRLNYVWFANGQAEWEPSESSNGGGYCRFYSGSNESGRLVSGKISLAGAADPRLHFKLLGYGEADYFSVEVINDFNSTDYQRIASFRLDTLPDRQYTEVDIPLADFASLPYIHLVFYGHGTHSDANIVIDEIEVIDVKSHDLGITSMTVSNDEVTVGKTTSEVTVGVANHGSAVLSGQEYSIDFYAGDRLFASLPGVEIPYFGQTEFQATYVPVVNDDDKAQIHAVINYADDQNPDNNESDVLVVYVFKPTLPVVTSLAGKSNGSEVTLTWNEPDLSGTPIRTVTDDFEQYRPFMINHFGDWTLIDKDQLPVTTTQWLYYPDQYEPMAWDIFNTDMITYYGRPLDTHWPAHSGVQFAMCMGAVYGDNDDWMITPELSGRAQTVKFWAKSSSEEDGHEMMRLYYSTTGKATTDFIALSDEINYVPAEWTEYSIELPESARYFALRCVSHNRLALQVDDFTYEECAHPLTAQFLGYNVYCDNQLLNEAPVTECTFTTSHREVATYHVCAVYDLGESAPSDLLEAELVGISSVQADKAESLRYDLFGRRLRDVNAGQLFIQK